MKWLSIAIVIVLSSGILSAHEPEQQARETFDKYLDLLSQGNYQAATEMWSVWDLNLGNHLGINYDHCPIKLETGTLLGRNLESLANGTDSVAIENIDISRGFAKITYSISGLDTTDFAYVSMEDTLRPELVTPLWVFAGRWEQLPSDYFDLTYRDQSLVQTENLDLANEFIADAGVRLGLSDKELALLKDRKVSIYLCESDGEVEQLTSGAGAWGYYQPADATVSRLLPDRAQLTQLLIAFKLQSLPPSTAPLMRYGTSTYFGGGYSRSANLALSLGRYIYLNDFSDINDLMSTKGFLGLEANPDFSYPVAALFCGYLFESLGLRDFFNVYLTESGDYNEIDKLDADGFKQRLTTAVGKDWPTIESEFHDYAQNWQYKDLTPITKSQGKLIYESGVPGAVVRIYDDSLAYDFEVTADSANFSVAILANRPGDYSKYESFLFKEQFPNTGYDTERLGILLAPTEVGTYDYFTNEITGKYIVGLTGDTPLNNGDNVYRCRIVKKLLPNLDRSDKKLISTR